jgi:hypothetical protein
MVEFLPSAGAERIVFDGLSKFTDACHSHARSNAVYTVYIVFITGSVAVIKLTV